ncbi:hypothetical protein OG453_22980 [Streptomyces sp. NBC_01381]|uniref:hypothetical protein n=1 Tax=Streptomyces sp. NBC_01381 TaxID=2903845 RepID=UPI0022528F81|nr:hypothetical protein [Streptomyces sp. NBC_01381]MCX4669510.1 hypothetical protein [Streptomyces sp. NBC_01381]
MSARRSLLTASAAGALLGALCFIPSANATGHESPVKRAAAAAPGEQQHRATHAETTTADTRLADTGTGVDTTPYVIGGTAFLGLGAGFIAYSVRRDRRGLAY